MNFKVIDGRLRPKKEATFGKKPFKCKDKNRKGSKKKSGLGVKVLDSRIVPKHKPGPSYIKWFHEVYQPPCFVCGTFLGIEFHHIKEHSTDKRIDSIAMPLCWYHHHGYELSPHGTPVKFREVYPMELQLKFAADMYECYLAEKL